jgi:hypothetical protein
MVFCNKEEELTTHLRAARLLSFLFLSLATLCSLSTRAQTKIDSTQIRQPMTQSPTSVNAGTFTGSQQNIYFQTQIGGCTPTTQWFLIYAASSYSTEGISACTKFPSGSTKFAGSGISGYVENASLSTSPIGVYGQGVSTATNATATGIAGVAADTAGFPGNVYGGQFNAVAYNATTKATGVLINGFFNVQSTSSLGLEIGPTPSGACPTCNWTNAIRLDTGASKDIDLVSGNSAGLMFFPVTSAVSQNSQGMVFISNKGGGGSYIGGINYLSNGQLNLAAVSGVVATSLNVGVPVPSGLMPSGSFFGLIGDSGGNLGTGTGKNYGVIGIARAGTDVVGDRAYGGWFKSTATTNVSSEVGIHVETNDAGGNAAEFGSAGSVKATITGGGTFSVPTIVSNGSAAALTGTGACATITTQHGGAWAGDAKCTGSTGASTFIITPGTTAPNGWSCWASDITTAANILRQSVAGSTTSCTIAGTVNGSDVLTFGAVAY